MPDTRIELILSILIIDADGCCGSTHLHPGWVRGGSPRFVARLGRSRRMFLIILRLLTSFCNLILLLKQTNLRPRKNSAVSCSRGGGNRIQFMQRAHSQLHRHCPFLPSYLTDPSFLIDSKFPSDILPATRLPE